MPIYYKPQEKHNPIKPTEPKKFYATAQTVKRTDLKELAQSISDTSTTVSHIDVHAVLLALTDELKRRIVAGGRKEDRPADYGWDSLARADLSGGSGCRDLSQSTRRSPGVSQQRSRDRLLFCSDQRSGHHECEKNPLFPCFARLRRQCNARRQHTVLQQLHVARNV